MARRRNREPVPPGWNSSGNQATYRGTSRYASSRKPGSGSAKGSRSIQVTSASGTPGPTGVLTTGHYSSSGQRMYGGYSAASGRRNRSGGYKSSGSGRRGSGPYSADPKTEQELIKKRTRKRLPRSL